MLSQLTKTALVVLNEISCGEYLSRQAPYALSAEATHDLLNRLCARNLIDLLPGKVPGVVQSYTLQRPPANKLGVINRVTRQYLSGISLTDFWESH